MLYIRGISTRNITRCYCVCIVVIWARARSNSTRATSTAIIPGIQAFPVFDAVRQTEHKKIPSTAIKLSTAFCVVFILFCFWCYPVPSFQISHG